jgi:two-component system, NarL family, sensor histidine kinase UhpB
MNVRKTLELMRISERCLHIISHRLILIGVFLGMLSWIVESFMHSQIFYAQHLKFIYHVFFPDIHELWMRLIIVTLFISFGVYAQRIVKALRQAETAIKQVNMELTQIFDTSADGMRVIDKNFNTLRVNTTFLELAKVNRQGIEDLKCYEVLKGTTCNTKLCPMLRIQRGEDRIEYDAVKIRQDGREIPCIVTATPFRDSSGNLIGIVENFKDISDRKKTEEELQRSHEQLRNVTSHLEMAREQERRAMAREIHDELGQALTGLKMDIHWLTRHLVQPKENISEKLKDMSNQLDQTVHTVQRLSSELRPCLLDDLGLSAAIEWQANTVHDRLGIAIDVTSIPDDITLIESCSITVFRIFQEALTNIARHSGATQVEIILLQKKDRVTLTVKDNGRGITEEQINDSNSLGLVGMRERTLLLKGSLTIQGKPGQGTIVSLSIPHLQVKR